MVNNRPAGQKIGNVPENDMRAAVQEALSGISVRTVSARTGIPFSTLNRWVNKAKESDDPESLRYSPLYNCRQIFNEAEENALEEYNLIAFKIHFGLTAKQARDLAYQFAVRNQKILPQSWDKNNTEGIEWFQSFMKRHKTLSLRRPEATSLSRATSFNHKNVSQFYINLENVLTKYKFGPQYI
ncbi:tigger transposable element-derived protein 6-like protein [Plakobranchus ocellatus]|uniref:Tigger transposable element-derived protein 6-like protein n=1 Tax=Plakobranchus ocellatus TaxID=259542 RepID=A0AAV4DS72_9GAST|nr:tigger transposable element-derived protein 6-like protein [Plakobranchus ocellatus]